MNNRTKLIYLDGMAQNDISAFLSPSEVKSYIETRHRTRRGTYEQTPKTQNSVVSEEI